MPGPFRLFWLGEAVSLLGTATTATLLPLLAATELDAGPGWMGGLAAATWAPWLVLGLPAGALVDWLQPRLVMICADLLGAAAAVSIPLAARLGTVHLMHLLAVAFTIGSGAVFFRAALPRLVIRVAPSDDLGGANSRIFATEASSTIVGPGLAGALTQVVSAAMALLLDALSFLFSALCLGLTRAAASDPGPHPGEPLRSRIRAGVTVVKGDPILRYLAPVAAIENVGLVGLLSLQMLFLVDDLGASPATAGLVLATAGMGGLAGAVVGPRVAKALGNARAIVVLQLLSIGCLLTPFATPGAGISLMVAGLFLAHAPIVADNVIRATWRMTYVPEHLQARVITTMQMLAFGAMPLAALLAGWLGHEVGVRGAIAVMLAIHAATALTFPFGPIGSRRHLPETYTDPETTVVKEAAA